MDEQDELELKVLLEKRLQREREAAGELLEKTHKFNNKEMIAKNDLISKLKDLLEIL